DDIVFEIVVYPSLQNVNTLGNIVIKVGVDDHDNLWCIYLQILLTPICQSLVQNSPQVVHPYKDIAIKMV
ncbi:8391_t:CDS:1, partial [Rhizophagus irregularis]